MVRARVVDAPDCEESAKFRPATPLDWESSALEAPDAPESVLVDPAPVAEFDDTSEPDTVDPPVTGVPVCPAPSARRAAAAVRFPIGEAGVLALAEGEPMDGDPVDGEVPGAGAGWPGRCASLFGFVQFLWDSALSFATSSSMGRVSPGFEFGAGERSGSGEEFGSAPLLMASSPTRKIAWSVFSMVEPSARCAV